MGTAGEILHQVYDQATGSLKTKVIAGGGGGGGLAFGTRTDSFTSTGPGVTFDASANPMKYFGVQVVKVGAVTSWSVDLEGSLDGVVFTKFTTVTNSSPGDSKIQYIPTPTLCAYFRANCTALTLGGGTSISTLILGSQ